MNDFKKKIFDIIFEPDTEDVKAEAPLSDVNEYKKEPEKEETFEPVKMPKAKDILYGKTEKSSPFINYTEVPRKEEPKIEMNNKPVYEMRENVSPIFGPIVQKEKKKRNVTEKEIQKAISSNFNSEYTGIVLSPIYGYDTNKANDARKAISSILDTDRAIADFVDEEEAFEIPEDMQETIKEAVEEAVIELTPKNNVQLETEEVEAINENNEQFYQEQAKELAQEIKQNVQVILEDIEEQEQLIKEKIEETKQEKLEEIEEPKEEIIEEKEEIQEFEIPVFNRNTHKATRSIYDTAPVQLFDFDELTSNDDDKDLFDELIGDDN